MDLKMNYSNKKSFFELLPTNQNAFFWKNLDK